VHGFLHLYQDTQQSNKVQTARQPVPVYASPSYHQLSVTKITEQRKAVEPEIVRHVNVNPEICYAGGECTVYGGVLAHAYRKGYVTMSSAEAYDWERYTGLTVTQVAQVMSYANYHG
jgi:hypothetical protein